MPEVCPYFPSIMRAYPYSSVMSQAMGEQVSQHAWTHIGAFTARPTRFPISEKAIMEEFESRVVRIASRHAQCPIAWFVVPEWNAVGCHLHALFGYTAGVRVNDIRAPWRLGFTRVSVYDPELDGAFYTTKSLADPTHNDRLGMPYYRSKIWPPLLSDDWRKTLRAG